MGNKSTRNKIFKSAKETKWLDLTDTKIRSIPIEVFYLQPRGLNLSLNSLMIPEDIGNTLSSLEFLDCSGCNLLKVPRSIVLLSNLKELVLSRNSLSMLPPLPSSLERLDISNNMFLQVPDHLQELPNLCWVSFVGNPCYTPNKEMVYLKGKSTIQMIVVGNIEIPIDSNLLKLNSTELETLTQVYYDIASPVYEGVVAIDRHDMLRRMGLSNLPITTLVDSFFKSFVKFSITPGELIDLRAFLIGLGIIFKGTVEEKIKFVFEMFDMNDDGFIELEDMIAIAKSGLLISVLISNQYNFEENEKLKKSVPVDQFPPVTKKLEDESCLKITTKEVDLTLVNFGKPISEIRVQQETVASVTKHKAYKLQWPQVKDLINKQFKEIQGANNRITLKDYQKYWFSNFTSINEFLNFYGSMFRYGP